MVNQTQMIKNAIKNKGMTPTQLANAVGVKSQNYHHWVREGTDLRLSTVNRIAIALGMKTSELIKLGE